MRKMRRSDEIWKPVPLYEGLYEVSDHGRVRSLNYNRTGKVKVMKPSKNKFLYESVSLWKNKKMKMFKVHRLVWEAFHGPIPENMVIDHISTVRNDNRLCNLRCVTTSENNNNPITKQKRADTVSDMDWKENQSAVFKKLHSDFEFKRRFAEAIEKRERNEEFKSNRLEALKKLHEDKEWLIKTVEAIRKACGKSVLQLDKTTGETIKRFECAMDASRELGIHSGKISLCCNGKRKSAGGYRWSFA